MTTKCTRRCLLQGVGATAALGLAGAFAAEGGAGVCLTLAYPAIRKFKFNEKYYREKHIPLLRQLHGDSIERIELRIGQELPAGPMPAQPQAFGAIVSIWMRDIMAYGASNKQHSAQVTADAENFTNVQAVIQYDRVVAEQGESRNDIKVGATCSSLIYPTQEGAQWDVDFFSKTYMPKMAQTFGPTALRRVEVCAQSMLPKAAFIAIVHQYTNQQSFMQAWMQKGQALMADAAKISTVIPYLVNSEVRAVG